VLSREANVYCKWAFDTHKKCYTKGKIESRDILRYWALCIVGRIVIGKTVWWLWNRSCGTVCFMTVLLPSCPSPRTLRSVLFNRLSNTLNKIDKRFYRLSNTLNTQVWYLVLVQIISINLIAFFHAHGSVRCCFFSVSPRIREFEILLAYISLQYLLYTRFFSFSS
jgi:hypothetical protein